MQGTDRCCRETDRAEAFQLLSELYRLPGADMAPTLRALEAKVTRACRVAAPYVDRMIAHIAGGGEMAALRVEFSRLFVGPFRVPAPPYGSVYLDGGRILMGPSTRDVLARYGEEGLGLSESFRDAPDHITAELEFVCYLGLKALEAGEENDPQARSGYLAKRRRFLTDHLGAWMPEFQRRIEEHAETGFFVNLAKATRAIIESDRQPISDPADAVAKQRARNTTGGSHEAFR